MLMDRSQVMSALVIPACLCPFALQRYPQLSMAPLWQGRLENTEDRLCSVALWALGRQISLSYLCDVLTVSVIAGGGGTRL